MQRCGWVSQDPLYIEYHDTEWGVAQKEGRQLFEMICLEGQQAGLSWITVLKKRQNYRQAFHQFDPVRVAAMGDDDIERLLQASFAIGEKSRPLSATPAPIWRWKKMASRSLILSGPSSTMRHR